MKQRDIVIIATQDFDDLRTRKQRWAERLAKANRVLYVETQMHWVTLLREWRRHRSRLRRAGRPPRLVAPDLWVWTPPIVLPFFQMFRFVGRVNDRLLGRMLRRTAASLGFDRLLLWLYTPYSAQLIDDLQPVHTVYECVDDFSAARGLINPRLVQRLEDETLRRVDLTIVTADTLADKVKSKTPHLHVSHNACDADAMAAANDPGTPVHPSLDGITGPVFGFVGAVAYWVDLELLAHLARSCPDAVVAVIGPVRVGIGSYRDIPNLKFFGRQPAESIPQFLRRFDVCLNPYKCDGVAEGASPLKLYEYLASRKPVVSTPMPEACRFGDVVAIASSRNEFVAACRRFVAEDSDARRRRQEAQETLARLHTWEHRFEEIERCLDDLGLAELPGTSVSHKQQKRLVHHVVINGLQVQGAELCGGYTYLTNIVREMIPAHPETRFTIITTTDGAGHFCDKQTHLQVHTVPNWVGWGPVRHVFERHLMHRWLSKYAADAYFLPYGVLPRVRVCPQVITYQNLYFLHAGEFSRWRSPSLRGRWYESLRLRALRRRLGEDVQAADRIIAVSETAYRSLTSRLGVPSSRIEVVYEAVGEPFTSGSDPDADAATLRRMHLPESYFLSVGAIAPNKNLPLLLEAYSRLQRRHPDVPHLILAGPDWSGFSRVIAAQVEQLGLQDHVHRIGFVAPAELAVLYRCAVAVVQLSSCESFGLPALEAMACGTPLIAANRSGLAEVSGKSALLIDPEDAEAVAGAMRILTENPEQRARWIRRGHRHAGRFTWTMSASGTYAAIAKAAGWTVESGRSSIAIQAPRNRIRRQVDAVLQEA